MLGRTEKRQNGRSAIEVGKAGSVMVTVMPETLSSGVTCPAVNGTDACHSRTKSGFLSAWYAAGNASASPSVPVSNE